MAERMAEDQLSTLDKVVLRIVDDVYRRTRQPVRTIALSAQLGKDDRNCRRYLTSLEERCLVERVGQRGGWRPKTAPALAAEVCDLRDQVAALWGLVLAASVEGAGLRRQVTELTLELKGTASPTSKQARVRLPDMVLN